jgi:hypothetical protein
VDLTDYDDTPYQERPNVAPVYTISLDVEADTLGERYVYVDGVDGRLARQRFAGEVFLEPTWTHVAVRWIEGVLTALISDPDGHNACGDCGNYVLGGATAHAPDCRWSRWAQRQA